MSAKKWIIGGTVAVVGTTPILFFAALAVVIALIAGLAVAFSGGMGAIVADEAKKQQDGVCTADDPGGDGTPISASQKEYVRTMIGVAKKLDIGERGQIIATMVMLQESGIQNYANTGENRFGYKIGKGTSKSTDWWLETAKLSLEYPHDAKGKDADSVGLYQQRASTGWGDSGSYRAESSSDHGRKAIERLLDPRWGAQAFFGGPGGPANPGLLDVSGWESKGLGEAAQAVQRSAFPGAYTKWEKKARAMVKENADAPEQELFKEGGGDNDGNNESEGDGDGSSDSVQKPMKDGTYTKTSDYGPRNTGVPGASTWHKGVDFAAPVGTPIYAAADGSVVAAGSANGFGQWIVIDHMLGGKKYSTVYGHMPARTFKVKKGDKVTAGQHIAGVGAEGIGSGPHLHFEVWDGGRFAGGKHINPLDWLDGAHGPSGGGDVECGDVGGGGGDSDADGSAKAVIDAAKSQLGVPYSWGGGGLDGPTKGIGRGAGTTGFDCSGLTRYAVYNGTGKKYELSRVSQAQWNETKDTKVSWDEMQAGDLIFWARRGGRVYHVAIYLGDNQMIEAPYTGAKVRVTDVRKTNFHGATRPDYSK